MFGLRNRRDTVSVGCICCAQMSMTLCSYVVQWNEILMQHACTSRGLAFPSTQCNESADAQHEASLREGWVALAVAWPNFLTIGVLTTAADAIGRKPAICLALLGQAVFTACIWLVPLSGEICLGGQCLENYWVILAITAAGAMTGGSAVTLAIMFAVLGDVSIGMNAAARTREPRASTPHPGSSSSQCSSCMVAPLLRLTRDRHALSCTSTGIYTVLEVFQWVGSTIGPLSGVWVARFFGGLRSAFGFYTCCLLLSTALVAVCPETLTPDRAVPFSFCRATPVANLRPFVQHPVLIRFAIVMAPPLCFGGAFIAATGNLYRHLRLR